MSSSKDAFPDGGSLADMAVKGTTVPASAAEPRVIKSVPRPDQITDNEGTNDYGAESVVNAADNATDMPRSVKDTGMGEQVVTGTGDALPAAVDGKRLHAVENGDVSKGHPRYDKHVRQKGSDQERGAAAADEEEEVIDGVVGGR